MYQWTDERVRELIGLTKARKGLYAKGSRIYKDAEAKKLAWEQLALLMSEPCTGENASKKFKYLRDCFVKEHKMIEKELKKPSGSAGGASKPHAHSEFYFDLLFLKEHIGMRRTTSNFSAPEFEMNSSTVEFMVCDEEKKHIVIDGSIISSTPLQTISCNDVKNAVHAALINNGSESAATCSSKPSDSSCSADEAITMASSTPSTASSVLSNLTDGEGSSGSSSPSVIRSKALASLLSGAPIKVPPSDYRRKKDNADLEVKKSLEKLNATAEAVMEKIKEVPSDQPIAKEKGDDPFSGMLQFAMKQVPQDKLLKCAMDMMKVADIYSRGGCPNVTE